MKLPEGTSLFYRKSKKRWVLAYEDPTRGRPQKVLPKEITTEKAASTWAADWLAAKNLKPAEVLRQKHCEGPTVAECAAKWLILREKDERVAPATLKGNRGHLSKHILPAFGARPIAAIDIPEVRAWLRGLRTRVGASTCRNVLNTFSALYSDALAEGWVKGAASPLEERAVRAELPPMEDSDPVALPIATAQKLIASPKVPLERRARYALAFTSGMRDGEIAGERLRDIDLAASVPTLRVEQAVAIVGAKGKGGFAKAKAPKTRKSRRLLPVHAAAVAAIEEWLTTGWPALVNRRPGPDDLLFPNPEGGGARPRSAEHIREDLRAVGLSDELDGQPIEFKHTRSSFASWLEANDVSEATRKRLMGHVARDVTQKHYTARDMERLAAAVATIELNWPGAGTVAAMVTSGTTVEQIHEENWAPPRRLERPTNGLGRLRVAASRGATKTKRARQRARQRGYTKGFCTSSGLRNGARGGDRHQAADLPPDLQERVQALAAMLALEDAYDVFLAAGGDEGAQLTQTRAALQRGQGGAS